MVRVTSEVGRLRRVLVHEPGAEVDRMVPAMMNELLFDDILYGDQARDEHARFRRVLQLCGVEVLEANDLLATAFEQPGARESILDDPQGELNTEDREQLQGMSPARLAEALVTGSKPRAHPVGADVEDLYTMPPLPNWCFQRDPQVVLGGGVVFGSMAAGARHREGLLSRTIFRYHPELGQTVVLFDPLEGQTGSAPLTQRVPNLEGGDVLVLSPEVIAVGISERTNKTGVRRLARALARRDDGPRWMVVVEVPRRRAFMHLDTLITPIDRDACLVYTPVILGEGTERAGVFAVDLHAKDPTLMTRTEPMLEWLAARGLDMEPIPCGGPDPVSQQREQWTDGANALAVAPGVIALYARNVATAAELGRHGFRIVEAEDLLLGSAEVDVDAGQRTCILLRSHEISRARGGPHCLTHPLVRDDL